MVDRSNGTITIAERDDAPISIDWDLYKVMEGGENIARHTCLISDIGFRCKWMDAFGKGHFNCGAFDIKGLLTENYVYPLQWKVCMIFISFGFIMMTITVFLTMVSCCRQAIGGKSIHNIAGAFQLIASKIATAEK